MSPGNGARGDGPRREPEFLCEEAEVRAGPIGLGRADDRPSGAAGARKLINKMETQFTEALSDAGARRR